MEREGWVSSSLVGSIAGAGPEKRELGWDIWSFCLYFSSLVTPANPTLVDG